MTLNQVDLETQADNGPQLQRPPDLADRNLVEYDRQPRYPSIETERESQNTSKYTEHVIIDIDKSETENKVLETEDQVRLVSAGNRDAGDIKGSAQYDSRIATPVVFTTGVSRDSRWSVDVTDIEASLDETPDPVPIEEIIDTFQRAEEAGQEPSERLHGSFDSLAEDTADRILSNTLDDLSPTEVQALLYSSRWASESTVSKIRYVLLEFADQEEYSDVPLEGVNESNLHPIEELADLFKDYKSHYPHLFDCDEDDLTVPQQELKQRYTKTFLRHNLSRT
ncbi:hypothetical protein GOC83_08190 [Haloarcula rubripromontorii]|uniref:Uncharacterized protein n=1 Tax=Haloarcula rubripromontorii TaxID=1705562 RepID=A0A847U024_9EURY|nr:hypothetical protein [Haloarcula rubripromontorii]NLV06106.1 hypothetical protein [Haloarcula rubripromontorii]